MKTLDEEKLNELAKEYKETKSSKTLEELFAVVDYWLNEKADYIFYKQNFNIDGKVCKLKDMHKIELEDILQELKLTVLELLQKFSPEKAFYNYFSHTLAHWFPEIMRKENTRRDLGLVCEGELYDEDEEKEANFDNLPAQEEKTETILDYEKLIENLTVQEKLTLNILRKNSKIKQQQLADTIGVTQQRADQILKSIRKKAKGCL